MSNSNQIPVELQQIRKLAARKLQQYSKSSEAIQECYLFEQEYLQGIRFESGAICFLWKSSENSALILRGDLLIESVSLEPGQEERRAA